MINKRFPNYPDDTDYTTNAPSYYDDLARKEKLIRLLAERIWGYEKLLDETLEQIQERFRAWDKNMEDLPEDVKELLQVWMNNGTFDHIINETIFNWKLDTTIFEQFRDATTTRLQQNPYNVKSDFGALGNGVSNPVYPKYQTIEELRIDYPFLTDNFLLQNNKGGVKWQTIECDWLAFAHMFREANITKKGCYIPKGNYFIFDPLPTIGDSTSIVSTEFGNFEIMGEGLNSTTLLFDIDNDDVVAFPLAEQSSGWNISKFRVKNINVNRKGVGFHFDKIMKNSIRDLQAIYFGIGFKMETYVTDLTNLNATNGVCGFYIGMSTSTEYNSLYGASNKPYLAGDVREHVGCGFYIENVVYSNFNSCASDGNNVAYKIKTINDYTAGSSGNMTFNTSGGEVNDDLFIIDTPKGIVNINGLSMDKIKSNKIAHIENASEVNISNYTNSVNAGVSLGENVGVGVLKLNNVSISTGGNPTQFPRLPVIDHSNYGVDDFTYKGLSLSNKTLANGNLITEANSLEFEIYARTNGRIFGAKIDIIPTFNNIGTTMNRGGTIYIGGRNPGVSILRNISSTNDDIVVTMTNITNDNDVVIGVRVLIEPFSGLANELSNKAIFKVETYFDPIGTNGFGKNHNVKLKSTYTGRDNLRLKGVDY